MWNQSEQEIEVLVDGPQSPRCIRMNVCLPSGSLPMIVQLAKDGGPGLLRGILIICDNRSDPSAVLETQHYIQRLGFMKHHKRRNKFSVS